MNIIRISTDNEISIHEFPEGSYREQNRKLQELIGPQCELYEHVMPVRLYTEFGAGQKPARVKGACVSMLIDEEGHCHNLADNLAGSYLYGADKHGCIIVGNILLVGEVDGRDGIDFCGISDSQFQMLYTRLEELVKKAGGF